MTAVKLGLIAVASTLALAVPSFAATNAKEATGTLTGTVGTKSSPEAYIITMNKPGAKGSTNVTVKAGTYAITIHDYAAIHNFHLSGPGINKKTSVPVKSTTKWTVTLKKGTYHFVCDPHLTIMHGILKVS
jgi:plastocyanin